MWDGQVLQSSVVRTGAVDPGMYAYYSFQVSKPAPNGGSQI